MSAGAAGARAAAFLALWVTLAGIDPGDLPAVILAVGGATWASLRLLPPGAWRLRPAALAGLALRFLRQSVVAGADVAGRALHPRLRVRPGLVTYRPDLPAGPARDAFCVLTSLVPGTVPAGANESGALVVHCLDVGQPVGAQLGAEEAMLARALGAPRGDG
jgi:multicomponent Na+:H+ antiporter subunit E